jgi:hypothetical protein
MEAKRFLKRLYGWTVVPVIAMHEMSHVVVGMLCGMRFSWKLSEFVWLDDSLQFELVPKNRRWTRAGAYLVPLAPVLWLATLVVMFNQTGGMVWGSLLMYHVYGWFNAIPSERDVDVVMNADAYSKYDVDSPELHRFLRMKHAAEQSDLDDREEDI